MTWHGLHSIPRVKGVHSGSCGIDQRGMKLRAHFSVALFVPSGEIVLRADATKDRTLPHGSEDLPGWKTVANRRQKIRVIGDRRCVGHQLIARSTKNGRPILPRIVECDLSRPIERSTQPVGGDSEAHRMNAQVPFVSRLSVVSNRPDSLLRMLGVCNVPCRSPSLGGSVRLSCHERDTETVRELALDRNVE